MNPEQPQAEGMTTPWALTPLLLILVWYFPPLFSGIFLWVLCDFAFSPSLRLF